MENAEIRQEFFDLKRAIRDLTEDVKSVKEMAYFNRKALRKVGLDEDKEDEVSEQIDTERRGIEEIRRKNKIKYAVLNEVLRSDKTHVIDFCPHSHDTVVVCPSEWDERDSYNHVKVTVDMVEDNS